MSVDEEKHTKMSLTFRRIKPVNNSLSTICKRWVIDRPTILRHSSHWTENYHKCIADAMKHCTSNDEEIRIACETSH